MYLLNTATLELHRLDKGTNVPPYAILSHVWGPDEQQFRDTPLVKDVRNKRGVLQRVTARALRRPSRKIRGACGKALIDGYKWLWADTTCIDAGNSAELSEAINSMFELYRDASMCYAYLEDVPPHEDPRSPRSAFRASRYFRRVWTLQELIAPASVIFLSSDWQPIGAKWRLADLIESITGIDRLVLTHKRPLEDVSIACRMSWAAKREARREEDRAYSLMGIFGVCMPTIYGERGRSAFLRLQEEIIKRSPNPDQTIFASGPALHDHSAGSFVASAREHHYEPQSDIETLFASSPSGFADCADISPIPLAEFAYRLGISRHHVPVYTHTSAGICMNLPVVPIGQSSKASGDQPMLGLLACRDGHGRLIALFLRSHPTTNFKRFVGGYVSRGSRVNTYCRTTRLSTREQGPIFLSARLEDVIIHSSRAPSTRARSSTVDSHLSSSTSSRHSAYIFFQPPCTIRISPASRKALERMQYVMPVLPPRGFRLTGAGEARSISFIGYESFTVHFGVCAVSDESDSGGSGSAQLWATVTFDTGSDLDSLLVKPRSDSSTFADDPENENDFDPSQRTVCPDESMLVQHWKDHRRSFGNNTREVRLGFSYPCHASDSGSRSGSSEQGMAEVYELDITFRGYYHKESQQQRRYRNSALSYAIGSVSGGGQAKSHY
ncbi:hypothetical protein C8Q77DRAFT_1161743 [Trametes polyzona]|nr:hypothetical protein C8Q77DRAFT_1161743 [Trametes polyzona]